MYYCRLIIYEFAYVFNVTGKKIESEHEYKEVSRKSEETTRKGGREGIKRYYYF